MKTVEHPDVTRPPARRITSAFTSRLGRNVGWNFVGQAWGAALTLVATPVIVAKLGAEGYGVIAMLTVITNFVWYVDLGLGQASVRYVADHAAREEWLDVRRVFWTSVAIYMALGCVAGLLMVIFASTAVESWFQIPVALQPGALTSFYLAAATFCVGLLNFAPASMLRGLQRFDLLNKVNIVATTVQPLTTVALLVAGFSIRAVVTGYLVVAIGVMVMNLALAARLIPDLRHVVWDEKTFFKLLRFGAPLSGSTIIVGVLATFEKFTLANTASMAAVAHYMVPNSVSSRLSIIPSSISSALYPAFSSLNGAGDRTRTVDLSAKAAKSTFLVFAPIVLILLVFGDRLLALWLGAEFARESAAVLQILVLAGFIQAFSWTPHMLIQAVGRSEITLRIYLIELVVVVPVTILSIDHWGAKGAAIAWLARVSLDTLLSFWWSGRLFQIGPMDNLRRSFDGQTLTILIGGVLLWLGRGVVHSGSSATDWTLAALGLTLALLLPILTLARTREAGR